MLDINQIKKSYNKKFHIFERGLLREYLQYQILSIIFNHPLSQKLSFLGGTCLRIVYQLPRFSEDIDFDNKNLTENEFKALGKYLQKELEKRGFVIELKFVTKKAFHCYIKFPELLYKHGISPQKKEKILIQVDTFDQNINYNSTIFILNKFEFFNQVRITPKDIILSQKLWTITQRSRLKGRDFFDIMFLLQTTKPNLLFLQTKFRKKTLQLIIDTILKSIKNADYDQLTKDVQKFLLNSNDAKKIKLFPNFLKQELVDTSHSH